jgi:hypothetical protein
MKPYDDAVADFLANKPIRMDTVLPQGIKLLLQSLEIPANLPFSRELWTYNLQGHFAKINEPTLVVIGKKDIQVDWKIDGKALEEAAAQKSSVTFAYPENANHLLKHEELPLESLTVQHVSMHYNAPDAKLDDEAANDILSWLKKQTQK